MKKKNAVHNADNAILFIYFVKHDKFSSVHLVKYSKSHDHEYNN